MIAISVLLLLPLAGCRDRDAAADKEDLGSPPTIDQIRVGGGVPAEGSPEQRP